MKPEQNHIITHADALVSAISAAKKRKAEIEAEVCRRIERVKSEFGISVEVQDRIILKNENELIELMTGRKFDIFGHDFAEGKRVDLPCGGALIASIMSRAKRVRGFMDRLKIAGMFRLIKVDEKVNWPEVDALDDAVLAQLGSCRVTAENFEYETC